MKVVDLSRRAEIQEAMDAPGCPEAQLIHTLEQFQLINRLFSRYRGALTHGVLRDMERERGRSYRLADLGAGGCDIARWLIRRCRSRGLSLRILALEPDPRIAPYARAANAGYPEIEVVEADALDGGAWAGADYVFANHLLHHLADAACVELIRRLAAAAPRIFLLSDLLRSTWAYYGFWLVTAPCFRDSFIVQDGLASIRRGFTLAEVRALAQAADPSGPVAILSRPPSRFLLWGGRLPETDPPIDCTCFWTHSGTGEVHPWHLGNT